MAKFFSSENAAQLAQDVYKETKAIARFTGMSTADDVVIHVDREISDYYLTESGENFVWSMAPGARKCTVDENNSMSIIALEGEADYTEDGSNGAVVLYVPKFYVKEVPLLYRPGTDNDYVIVKADCYLSAYRKGGYSTDIIFHNLQGYETDYVLVRDGAIYDADNKEWCDTDEKELNYCKARQEAIAKRRWQTS